MTELQDVIEINDPDIDVEDIMARIRERIQQRRAQAADQGLDYDRLADQKGPAFRSTAPSDSDLYYDLYQVRNSADSIWISLSVVGRSIPVIGGLVNRVRRALHNVVLYYVNMLAGRQVVFNRAVTGALQHIVDRLETTPSPESGSRDDELAELRQRVEALERALAQRDQA